MAQLTVTLVSKRSVVASDNAPVLNLLIKTLAQGASPFRKEFQTMRSLEIQLVVALMLMLVSAGLSGCIALSSVSSLPGVSSVVPAPSIDGDWLVVRPGFSTFSLSLFEKGGKITGSAGTEPYSNPLAGTRTGSKVELIITFHDGTTVTYSGDINADGSQITGVIGSGSSSADTFTANKKASSC